jgi:hypothetical protein
MVSLHPANRQRHRSNAEQKGYGSAIKAGIEAANGTYIMVQMIVGDFNNHWLLHH